MSKRTRRRFLGDTFFLAGSALMAAASPGRSPEDFPSYLKLHRNGLLSRRAEELRAVYENCRLCPRDCRVDRLHGQTGRCQAPATLKVSSAVPHFGEEAPLVGKRGSGTIFFSHCGLRCVYCQNYSISLEGEGVKISEKRLAEAMIKLQGFGCHNINLVTPTHYVPGIVGALVHAVEGGLRIPLVYNTSGYERLEILQLLEGIVDIYLPDFKYADPAPAARLSEGAFNYPHYARIALKEMHRQVGDLVVKRGVARKGLMIRHLVLPNGLAGTAEVAGFVAGELSPDTYVHIMRQYRPEYKAKEYPEIARRITRGEFNEAVETARKKGLKRLDV